jgi:hypothetical protein
MKHPVKIAQKGNRIEVESYYYTENKHYQSKYSRITMMLRYLFKNLHNA